MGNFEEWRVVALCRRAGVRGFCYHRYQSPLPAKPYGPANCCCCSLDDKLASHTGCRGARCCRCKFGIRWQLRRDFYPVKRLTPRPSKRRVGTRFVPTHCRVPGFGRVGKTKGVLPTLQIVLMGSPNSGRNNRRALRRMDGKHSRHAAQCAALIGALRCATARYSAPHSTFIPAALITRAHFAISTTRSF